MRSLSEKIKDAFVWFPNKTTMFQIVTVNSVNEDILDSMCIDGWENVDNEVYC